MHLLDMSLADITEVLQQHGQPKYRAAQVYGWLSKGYRPSEMTNIPASLRDILDGYGFGGAAIERKLVSSKDGTCKYLFCLEDGNLVEGVLMRYKYGNTVCISTQVGCRMGCAFCASTLEGCVRNLNPGEMLGEVLTVERDGTPENGLKRNVTNIVLMGSGEPMDNLDNVLSFLRLVTSPDGINISPRNISVSTCGLVPNIYRFMKEAPHVTLSISLHAHSDEIRSKIMPVNQRYPVAEVVKAARDYAELTGRRVVFEYALIHGLNASKEDAKALSRLLAGMNCHVNLIPLNPVPERNLQGATRQEALQFNAWLTEFHTSATIRREMGQDINGACGQLRRRVINDLRGQE